MKAQNVGCQIYKMSTCSGEVPNLHNCSDWWHTLSMPKRIKQVKRPTDVNQLAHHLECVSTSDSGPVQATKAQISLFMAQMGYKGGKKGGKRRLETMTAEERSDVARRAATARWDAKRKQHKRGKRRELAVLL